MIPTNVFRKYLGQPIGVTGTVDEPMPGLYLVTEVQDNPPCITVLTMSGDTAYLDPNAVCYLTAGEKLTLAFLEAVRCKQESFKKGMSAIEARAREEEARHGKAEELLKELGVE